VSTNPFHERRTSIAVGVQAVTLISLSVGLIAVAASVAMHFGAANERAAVQSAAIDRAAASIEAMRAAVDSIKEGLRRELATANETIRSDLARLSDRVADLRSRLDRIEAGHDQRPR
jgi:Skp family chaperone for outer membrane proteins